MNCYKDYNTKFGLESIVRHRVDQLTAGRYADPLVVAVAADDVGQGSLPLFSEEMM